MRLFSDVSSTIDDPWLRRAFVLAESGRGTTSPNPLVGCVVVRNGEIVGEGYHARAGAPHAEAVALVAAGPAARGATAYVTLEPCTHHGRTPPCTDALVTAGVARVVVGMSDSNETVSGGGIGALRSHGITVDLAQDDTPFRIQNEAWLASLSNGRSFVRAKVALSLDGRPALESGKRASITGIHGTAVTQRLREGADAVLVGGATAAIDDPALTVRDAAGHLAERQPVRIVLLHDTLPPAHLALFTDDCARTLVLAPPSLADSARHTYPPLVDVAEYDDHAGVLGALRTAFGRGILDLLVEPGPRLFTAFWDAGLIDELVTVQAGGVAGAAAPSLHRGQPGGGTSAGPPALMHHMEPLECGIVGDVVVVTWRRHAESEAFQGTLHTGDESRR